MPLSIRTRLTLWYSGILAFTMLMFGVVVYLFLSYMLYSNQKDQMDKLGKLVESQMKFTEITINGQKIIQPDFPHLDEFRYSGFFLQLVTSNGQIARSSKVTLPLDKEMLQAAVDKNVYYKKVQTKGFVPLYIYNKYIKKTYPGTGDVLFEGVLQIAVTVDDIDAILKNVAYFLVLFALLVVILAATLGMYLARKALRPIENVIAAANMIEKGTDLDKRIPYSGPNDEIGRLTSTINGMIGRIEGMYNELEESNHAQRRFVSDASHELRTPLTTIRGNVEMLEKMWGTLRPDNGLTDEEKQEISLEAMQDIAGEASRMSRLVNDLLSLARADTGHEMTKEEIPLRPLVDEAARKAQMMPRTADWHIGDLSALEGVRVWGNRDYLQQMLYIFIENAFKYTERGYVRLDAVRAGGQVGLRIEDTGIGMDGEDVPNIFERFYRADPSRGQKPGTGLGLAIAKWIIDEHRGSIEVKTRKGEGTVFLVWLPAAGFHQLQG